MIDLTKGKPIKVILLFTFPLLLGNLFQLFYNFIDAIIVGQTLGNAVAHGGHQRMRGAQVNANGNAPLVRVGGLAGFGNLQQRHGFFCSG